MEDSVLEQVVLRMDAPVAYDGFENDDKSEHMLKCSLCKKYVCDECLYKEGLYTERYHGGILFRYTAPVRCVKCMPNEEE